MKTFARLDGVTVAEILELEIDPAELFHPSIRLIDVTEVEPKPEPGWSFVDETWLKPRVVVVIPRLTSLEFMALLTDDEQHMLAAAGQQNALVLLWLIKLAGASYIDLSDPQTIGGIGAMVSAGLISQSRAADILANQSAPVPATTPATVVEPAAPEAVAS